MLIYSAPMEGITAYPFRMTHRKLYGGIDRYFLPFVEAHQTLALKTKEKKDLLPEHNPGFCSVPQLMSNRAELALAYICMLQEYGFSEVNFNLGCPSGTVTAKKKGAGFLTDPDAMDRFFDELFTGLDKDGYDSGRKSGNGGEIRAASKTGNGGGNRNGRESGNNCGSDRIRISVKTRIGMYDTTKADELIQIYSRYPFSEVIVHPRLGKDAYKGPVDMETFGRFYEGISNPVSYNGDVKTAQDALRIMSEYPRLHAIMIGRGLLADPALAEKIRSAGQDPTPPEDPRFSHFLDQLEKAWMEDLGDPVSVLYRMKEFWSYLSADFKDSAKVQKKVTKTRSLSEYHDIVRHLMRRD